MENAVIPTQQNFKTNYKDIYRQVTDTIIAQLEKGVIPWQKPWSGPDSGLLPLPFNFTTGNNYRGINIVLLWSANLKHNFQSNEWGSFKQWQAKGEAIRKGEKGNLVIYYDTLEREKDGEIKKTPFLKSSHVFNREQLVSYVPTEPCEALPKKVTIEQIETVETFVKNTEALIEQH